MPIDKAMDALKASRAASPDVMPSASPDTSPLQGWVKMPLEVPMPMMLAASAAAAASANPPPPATLGDAGAAPAAVDAGAAGVTGPDGGIRKNVPRNPH
jgi:hypothetical protein